MVSLRHRGSWQRLFNNLSGNAFLLERTVPTWWMQRGFGDDSDIMSMPAAATCFVCTITAVGGGCVVLMGEVQP